MINPYVGSIDPLFEEQTEVYKQCTGVGLPVRGASRSFARIPYMGELLKL
jgi:hypothetical protein